MSDARLVEIGNGVANLPVEKLEEVARMFCRTDDDFNAYKKRLHARSGLLAATNGYCLIQICDARIQALAGSNDNILNFRLNPEPTVVIAEGEYVTDELFRLAADAASSCKNTDRFILSAYMHDCQDRKATCPCCGKEFYVDDDCVLHEYDEYVEENMPGGGNYYLNLVSLESLPKLTLDLYHFWTCVKAARMLGGPCKILANDRYLLFRGENYLIALIAARGMEDADTDATITLPAKGGAE